MINEELISAYLDGELTAQEQAQVERALASDARLRQLHDDLRALRQRLQVMPQQKLGADFAERVLRAAVERANPSQRGAEGPAAAAAVTPAQREPEVLLKSHHGETTVVERAQHEPLTWRVMVWSIAGLAAAIAFVLMLPEPTSRIAEVGKNTVVQDNKEGQRTSTSEDDVKTKATPGTATPTNGVVAEGKGGARDEARYDFANKDENLKELNRADETDKAKETLREGAKQGGGDLLQQEPKAAATRGAVAGAVPGASRGSGGAGAVAPAVDQTKKTNDGERGIQAKSAFAADAVRQSGAVAELDEAAKATDDVLVVRLEVSPEQFKARGIDAVLAKQSIYFNDHNGRALQNENGETLDKKRAEEKVRDKTEEQRHAAQADRKAENKLVHEAEQLARTGDVDVVYVEASLEQVEAALAELSDKLGKGVTLDKLADAKDHFEDFDHQAPRVRRNAVAAPPTAPAEKDEGRGDDAGAAGGGLGAAGKEAEATRFGGGEGLSRKREAPFARRLNGNVRAQSFSEEAAAPEVPPKPGIAKADLAAGNAAPADAPPPPAPVLSDAAAQEKPAADDRSEFGAKTKQQATKRVRVLFLIQAKADEK
jgi:hypothetical protein